MDPPAAKVSGGIASEPFIAYRQDCLDVLFGGRRWARAAAHGFGGASGDPADDAGRDRSGHAGIVAAVSAQAGGVVVAGDGADTTGVDGTPVGFAVGRGEINP